MKYIFLSLILSSLSILNQAQKSYTIKGTVANYPNGEIYLISNLHLRDTLVRGTISNGKFRLTGKTEFPQAVHFRIKGVVNGPTFFLENTRFTAQLQVSKVQALSQEGRLIPVNELDNELKSNIQGGNDQQVANQYWELLVRANQQSDTLRTLYSKAQKNNDRLSLKRLEEKNQSLQIGLIQEVKKLLQAHSDSYVSAYVIQEYLLDLYEEESEIIELYHLLGMQARHSAYGQEIASNLSPIPTPQQGEIIPNFTLTDLQQVSHSLYDLKGKIKILDFWANWCSPCLNEIPELAELYKHYKSKGVEIITITLDKEYKPAKQLQKKHHLTWTTLGRFQVTDTNIEELFHIQAIPYKIILDENNRIVKKGNIPLNAIRETIDPLLE